MVEGKESVALALPFCTGTVTGTLILEYCCSGIVSPFLLISITIIIGILLLILRYQNRYKIAVAGAVLFVTGAFCVWSFSATAALGGERNFIMKAAGAAAAWLKDAIAALPFSDPGCNALASALITGDRSLLSAQVTESFRVSGASHLLALSGMHLGIIYMIIAKPFPALGKKAVPLIFRCVAICSATGFYTIMTGASASIVRAFLFILLNELALVTGRKRRALSALCAALTIQCALNPPVIATASFQLSYLAVCGIIFLYPRMRDLFPMEKKEKSGLLHTSMRKIWDSAALTISCQVFTGPLAWLLFDSVPAYFLIANLIAVPLTTLAIPLVLVLVVLQTIGWLPYPAVWAVGKVMETLIGSIEIIGTL